MDKSPWLVFRTSFLIIFIVGRGLAPVAVECGVILSHLTQSEGSISFYYKVEILRYALGMTKKDCALCIINHQYIILSIVFNTFFSLFLAKTAKLVRKNAKNGAIRHI
ncbi:MAG: hypothetical protein FWE84_00115 [Firmicutes bacterium]|nr:hypothetical protein [Bacillota bacterium]